MTGPGPGKVKLDVSVVLVYAGSVERLEADVYLHLRGWSRARVTHLDVEAPGVERLVGGLGSGVGAWIRSITAGIAVEPRGLPWRLELRGDILNVLERVGGCRGFVGGKHGGIFIGMESKCLRMLEEEAAKKYHITPRSFRRSAQDH